MSYFSGQRRDGTDIAINELREKIPSWGDVSAGVMEGVYEEIDSARGDVVDIAEEQGVAPAVTHGLIRGVGAAGMAAGNILEVPFELVSDAAGAVIPDFIKNEYNIVMRSVAENLTDSAAFKRVMEEAQKNPQKAKELVSALRTLDVTGVRHMGGPAVNDLLDNVITKLEGFYSGPAGAVTSFAREGAKGSGSTLREQFDPTAIAQKREFGTGAKRRNEAVNAATESEKTGSKHATVFIGKQQDDRLDDSTIFDMLPSMQASSKGTTRWGNQDKVKELLRDDPDTPEEVLDWFVGSTGRGLNPDVSIRNPLSFLKSGMPKLTNWRENVNNTIFNVRRPDSGVDGLAAEARGFASTGSVLQRGLRGGAYENTLARHNMPDNFESFAQFVRVNDALESPSNWPPFLKERFNSPSAARDYYYKALNKPAAQRTEKMNEVLGFMNRRMHDRKHITDSWIDNDNQTIKYAASYLSEAKDLGGVGFRGFYDYKNGKSYTSVIDGHDMFGTNPAGGVGLWNSTPVLSSNLTGNTPSPSKGVDVKAKEQEAMNALVERTGIQPLKRESRDDYRNRTGVQQRDGEKWDDYVKRAEQETGLKMRKIDETPGQYEARVLREHKAPVKAEDYLQAGQNLGLLASSGVDIETTAGGLPAYLMNSEAGEAWEALRQNITGNVRGQNATELMGGN